MCPGILSVKAGATLSERICHTGGRLGVLVRLLGLCGGYKAANAMISSYSDKKQFADAWIGVLKRKDKATGWLMEVFR